MTPPPGGAVDNYLDQLFDRLAGTGRRGRRILAEAEDHLLHAVEDAASRGIDRGAAEEEAVARFGNARAVMGTVSASTRLAIAGPLLATVTWLLTGVGVLAFGLSGLLTWVVSFPHVRLLVATNNFGNGSGYFTDGTPGVVYVDQSEAMWPMRVCVDPNGHILSTPCYAIYRHSQEYVTGQRLEILWFLCATAVGSILLAALWLARRRTRMGLPAWTPPRSELVAVLTVFFGLVAMVLVAFGVAGVLEGPGMINGLSSSRALADLVTGFVCAATAALIWRLRRASQR